MGNNVVFWVPILCQPDLPVDSKYNIMGSLPRLLTAGRGDSLPDFVNVVR